MERISLLRLFLVFLKIGLTSFGGNVALVAAVRKELCERKKVLTDEQVLDFTTLGNILPGPLATNVISACGYAIRGLPGALMGLMGVILPALVLICVLAEFYFRHGNSPALLDIFGGLLAGVAAIITATAWSLAKKNIKNPLQVVILVAAGAAIFFLKGFFVTLSVIVIAGLLGFIFFKTKPGEELKISSSQNENARSLVPVLSVAAVVVCGLFLYIARPDSPFMQDLRLMGLTFGSMSVTLFGGGYVFIPAIEKVVVGAHHWVNSREFADGIAMGQITPGPVAITASFVGYKVRGIWGAVVATIAIFFPPAILMLLAQQFVDRIKDRPEVESVFKGVRPAVIGMILASVWIIGRSAPQDWQSLVTFAVIFTLVVWKNYDTAILVLIAGVMGFVLHLL